MDKDLDETRRLLYMAMAAPVTSKYNLAGTLVNALAHHHAAEGIKADEALNHVVTVIECLGGSGDPDYIASGNWVLAQISRITEALGDAPAEIKN